MTCRKSSLEYWSDFTYMYDVDDDGNPVSEVDHTDGDLKCYYCNDCEDEFNSFEEAKAHYGSV